MGRLVDLTGRVFGRLTVLERAGRGKDGKTHWQCLCVCGNVAIVRHNNLVSGGTRSCGCIQREHAAKMTAKRNKGDGRSKEALYKVWWAMKGRCNNPNVGCYPNYGGRGIKVCEEWENDYPAFKEWALENGYEVGLSIDRINPNGNYEPLNCRWISITAQQNNKRNNRRVTFGGETLTVSQWAERTGISKTTIRRRLDEGWTVERALTEPVKEK